MSQSRLSLVAHGPEMARIRRFLENRFEDDGYPIAVVVRDEARDLHEISVYVDSEEAETVRDQMLDRLGSDAFGASIETEALPDLDWVSESLKGLQPVEIGRFVVHGNHDRHAVTAGRIGIEIEAGLAFGTGHHGTTAGCLAAIDRLARRGVRPNNALDLGAGSAVLAIGYAKVMGSPILATDIDPVAVAVSEENIALNRVSHLVSTLVADGFSDWRLQSSAPFDLVIANILAGPLIELAPAMRDNTTAGARLILSGILVTQERRVLAAYRSHGFIKENAAHYGEWTALELRKA